ncbi:MAG: penicillin-binding transpeptidase domain-containing protein [Eubacteriales bacterium]|nr:penicillin-binding transpeptidase domain-containing protein [Eubacteriales bacterium]
MDGQLKNRFIIIYIFIAVVFVVICSQLFRLQVIEGESYRILAENRLFTTETVKAPRGEILDRNGIPLVTNRIGFGVSFRKEFIEKGQLNSLILSVVNTFKATGEGYADTLPVTLERPFSYIFSGASTQEAQKNRNSFLKSLELSSDTTPVQLLNYYVKKYNIDPTLSPIAKRAIVGVRYEMENHLFSNNTPYTFSTDVSMNTVTIIKENSAKFQGISITVEPIREYTYGNMASHILGRVGVISKPEYDKKTENGKGYKLTDNIGKDGIEQYLEDYLKGKDGYSGIYQNLNGNLSQKLAQTSPQTGSYAILTIDAKVQQTLERSLEETIIKIQKEFSDAQSGAAVVIDVKSGEVLGMASYPTYNIASFNEDYQQLIENPLYPLWNRAIGGAYAPGSTFKMLTAVAALSEGVITESDTIVDTGVYKYYDDYQPRCWAYAQGGHGAQNITQALMNSCNYYFYEVGRRLGIDNLEKYAKKFGLGEKTGIEISGEISGILASKDFRKKSKRIWYPGDTLQAAIGQSDHIFTPIQMANYIATLANGGTRYKPHLIKSVNDYTDDSKTLTVENEIVDTIDMNKKVYNSVIQGMKDVAQTGTAASIFRDYPIPVGCKTGTATVAQGNDNGIFVAFAPLNDPQIAVVSVVEHGGHGSYLGGVAKDIFDLYLMADTNVDRISPKNTLIP